QPRQEVLASHVQDVIDEAVQMGIVAERKMSLENHSIKAGQGGYNQGCELRDKPIDALHGVHLMVGLSDTTIMQVERHVSYSPSRIKPRGRASLESLAPRRPPVAWATGFTTVPQTHAPPIRFVREAGG